MLERADRGLTDRDLLELARENRRKLLDAADGLATMVAELRRRLDERRAAGLPPDDQDVELLEVHVKNLRVQHLSLDPNQEAEQ